MHRPQKSYDIISQGLLMLRGWAIVWIVAYHLMGNTRGYLVLDEAITTLSKGGLKNIIDTGLELFIAAGSTGVNVFLIISGFGLTASWWKKYGAQGIEKIPLIEFWRKRVFRIFPSFWAAIALSTGLYFINSAWAPFGQSVWQQGLLSPLLALLATVSTLRNFMPDYYYFLNGAWWYIGLSVQLYLVFPYFIQIGCRWGWGKLLTLSLLFSLAYRAIFFLSPMTGPWNLIALAFFPARLFEFAFGIYLAMTFLQPANDSKQVNSLNSGLNKLLFQQQFIPVNFCLFAIGLSFKWLAYPALSIFEEALIGIGLFCGLIGLTQIKILKPSVLSPKATISKALNLRQISRISGKHSYGIYLTHMNAYLIIWPIATRLIPSYWPRFLLVMLACCAVGIGFEAGFVTCSNLSKGFLRQFQKTEEI